MENIPIMLVDHVPACGTSQLLLPPERDGETIFVIDFGDGKSPKHLSLLAAAGLMRRLSELIELSVLERP